MFVLITKNSGLRVGEQKQLRWEDVQVEEDKDKEGNTVKLARIGVRAATSRVRKGRTLLCRDEQYFKRIEEGWAFGDPSKVKSKTSFGRNFHFSLCFVLGPLSVPPHCSSLLF